MDVKLHSPERFAKLMGFTTTETEVFLLLTKRVIVSNEIGRKQGISHHTVSNHLKNMFQKTKTHSKADLLAFYVSEMLYEVKPEYNHPPGGANFPCDLSPIIADPPGATMKAEV